MTILHPTITGMTCGKCEKLMREGITDEVAGVTEVENDRPSVKAKISSPNLGFSTESISFDFGHSCNLS